LLSASGEQAVLALPEPPLALSEAVALYGRLFPEATDWTDWQVNRTALDFCSKTQEAWPLALASGGGDYGNRVLGYLLYLLAGLTEFVVDAWVLHLWLWLAAIYDLSSELDEMYPQREWHLFTTSCLQIQKCGWTIRVALSARLPPQWSVALYAGVSILKVEISTAVQATWASAGMMIACFLRSHPDLGTLLVNHSSFYVVGMCAASACAMAIELYFVGWILMWFGSCSLRLLANGIVKLFARYYWACRCCPNATVLTLLLTAFGVLALLCSSVFVSMLSFPFYYMVAVR